MSLFTNLLGSFKSEGSQAERLNPVEQFSNSLPSGDNPLTVSVGRLVSNMLVKGNEDKRDPSNLPISKHRIQFALNMKQLDKVVKRITLLECVIKGMEMPEFNLSLKDAYKPKDEKLLKKICPGVFAVESKEEQLKLLHEALDYHNSRLTGLLHQIVRWTFLQPNESELTREHVFKMITEVLSHLKRNFKSNDPTVPFLKIAVQERAKWYLHETNQNSFDQLFDFMRQENELIFNEIPDMYYNSFVGADHPKVQENLRNQNDLVKILDSDIKERIVQLQLQAIAEVLAPSHDEIGVCAQVLQNHFMDQGLGVRETQLLHTMMKNWRAQVTGQLQVVPLEYFITHHPSHLDPDSQLARDLQEYNTLQQRALEIQRDAPLAERSWLARTAQIITEKEDEIARIEQMSQKYMQDYVKQSLQLAKFSPKLDESVTDLQIKVWTLEAELAKANPFTKKFIEIGLHQAKGKLNKKLGIAVQKATVHAVYTRAKNELERLGIARIQAQSDLQRAKDELVEARIKFREIMSQQLQTIKDQQHRLAQKEFKFYTVN